jgi:hypothetical protein
LHLQNFGRQWRVNTKHSKTRQARTSSGGARLLEQTRYASQRTDFDKDGEGLMDYSRWILLTTFNERLIYFAPYSEVNQYLAKLTLHVAGLIIFLSPTSTPDNLHPNLSTAQSKAVII